MLTSVWEGMYVIIDVQTLLVVIDVTVIRGLN